MKISNKIPVKIHVIVWFIIIVTCLTAWFTAQ